MTEIVGFREDGIFLYFLFTTIQDCRVYLA